MENNYVEMSGVFCGNFEFSHETYGEKFFNVGLKIKRTSGNYDTIILLVSERIINVSASVDGKYAYVYGNIRTYNDRNAEFNKLKIMVFVDAIDVLDIDDLTEDVNYIELNGTICKTSKIRNTPMGRKICDSIIAVNRPYGKSDYIPIVTWGRNASNFSNELIGTKVRIIGRLQSRKYNKNDMECTAYELSVQSYTA